LAGVEAGCVLKAYTAGSVSSLPNWVTAPTHKIGSAQKALRKGKKRDICRKIESRNEDGPSSVSLGIIGDICRKNLHYQAKCPHPVTDLGTRLEKKRRVRTWEKLTRECKGNGETDFHCFGEKGCDERSRMGDPKREITNASCDVRITALPSEFYTSRGSGTGLGRGRY